MHGEINLPLSTKGSSKWISALGRRPVEAGFCGRYLPRKAGTYLGTAVDTAGIRNLSIRQSVVIWPGTNSGGTGLDQIFTIPQRAMEGLKSLWETGEAHSPAFQLKATVQAFSKQVLGAKEETMELHTAEWVLLKVL